MKYVRFNITTKDDETENFIDIYSGNCLNEIISHSSNKIIMEYSRKYFSEWYKDIERDHHGVKVIGAVLYLSKITDEFLHFHLVADIDVEYSKGVHKDQEVSRTIVVPKNISLEELLNLSKGVL